jgi:hypothetical protein
MDKQGGPSGRNGARLHADLSVEALLRSGTIDGHGTTMTVRQAGMRVTTDVARLLPTASTAVTVIR